ncbi:MAG: dihydropteroate synthase [Thermoleophilia bacterium]|nr:dihydropteroate synthase [Thermoleophilia bacterium]
MIPVAGRPQVLMLRDTDEVRRVLHDMRVSAGGIDIMDKKALFRVVRVKGLDVRAANILKQEMLARGGEVATSREVYEMGGSDAGCLIMGTLVQYERLLPKLRQQPFGLRALADALETVLRHHDAHTPVCHPGLDLRRGPLIMGALNVTPDSFSDPGDFFDHETAVKGARRMVDEGADIVDVGGESTRPGSDRTPLEEELRRVLPVVEALAPNIAAPLSVDTYRHEVAAKALERGAFMINDVTALRGDSEMVAVVRDAGCPVVLMHMLGEPKTMQENPVYENVVEDLYSFFAERLTWAVDQGVEERNLIIDPGIGFGKTLAHNLALIRHLQTFRSLGRPVLLGASRKRFIGAVLGLPEPKDRVIGTVATSVIAAMQDVDIVRVHDVAENAQAIAIARAVFPCHDNEPHG